MFDDLSGKFGKLKMPEGSLIKKLERIKKSSSGAALASPEIEQLREEIKKAPEELNKKIEELINSKTEEIKANSEAVKKLESQVSKLDQIVSSGKKGTDDFKERLDKMDETVLELLSLYEVVSSTVNPFVDNKDNPMTQKLADIERKVEELGQRTPEVPPDIENKFRVLEAGMEELKKTVESNPANDAFVEKIAGHVLEQIKPKAGVQAEIAKQAAPQSAEGAKLPYLDNRPETSIILLNWIEFLLEKVGRNNLIDILEYYIEIGWISEEVYSKMMDYANGIDYYVEKPTWKLLPEDHTKSLMFIEQLKGKKIDRNTFSRLERDLTKIMCSSEILVP